MTHVRIERLKLKLHGVQPAAGKRLAADLAAGLAARAGSLHGSRGSAVRATVQAGRNGEGLGARAAQAVGDALTSQKKGR